MLLIKTLLTSIESMKKQIENIQISHTKEIEQLSESINILMDVEFQRKADEYNKKVINLQNNHIKEINNIKSKYRKDIEIIGKNHKEELNQMKNDLDKKIRLKVYKELNDKKIYLREVYLFYYRNIIH